VRRAAVFAAVLSLLASSGATARAQGPAPGADRYEQGRDPRGLVLDGLVRHGPSGVCRGNYELAHRDRVNGVLQALCTHGPDPAPAGVDVRQRRPPDASATLEGSPSVAPAQTGIQCYGNGSDGYRVQLVYARAANVPDRFSTYQASFVQWAANVDLMTNASAAKTGGTRHVRFVTGSSCLPVIERVTMSNTGDDTFSNTIAELRARGFTRSDRKYLVWVDANVYCGIGQIYYDDRANPAPGANYNNGHPGAQGLVSRVDNACWGHANSVEAHELMHNLGGVQQSAPNSTPGSHCTNEYDRMCYVDGAGVRMVYRCPASHENRFDCNNDDYFHTSPPAGSYLATHWNTANSAFLATAPGGTAPPPTTTTTTVPVTTTVAPTTTTTKPPATTTTTVAPTTTTKPPGTTTTTTTAGVKPSAPRSLTVSQPSPGSVRLAWQPPTTGTVTGYRVYRGTGVGTPVLQATVGNVLSVVRTGEPLGIVSYHVTAYNAAGESVASNRVWWVVR
jgi:hypothetical protein